MIMMMIKVMDKGAKAPKALQQTKWVLADIERRRVVGQRSQVTTNNREVWLDYMSIGLALRGDYGNNNGVNRKYNCN